MPTIGVGRRPARSAATRGGIGRGSRQPDESRPLVLGKEGEREGPTASSI